MQTSENKAVSSVIRLGYDSGIGTNKRPMWNYWQLWTMFRCNKQKKKQLSILVSPQRVSVNAAIADWWLMASCSGKDVLFLLIWLVNLVMIDGQWFVQWPAKYILKSARPFPNSFQGWHLRWFSVTNHLAYKVRNKVDHLAILKFIWLWQQTVLQFEFKLMS